MALRQALFAYGDRVSLFSDSQLGYLKLLFQRQLTWQGAWAAGAYQHGDLVTHSGTVWLATEYRVADEPGVTGAVGWSVFGGVASGSSAVSLNGLSDVTLTAPIVAGQVIRYSGSAWVNSALSLNDLSNVTITSPVSGQSVRYNGSVWVNSALSFNDLFDVTITSPVSGHTVFHNGTAWVNNTKLLWDTSWSVTYGADGRLVLDYSGVSGSRAWTAPMPGLVFKQPGALISGLYLNFEDADGDRLDMGWGGANGGNFELYSKNHARHGQFRVVYGGGDFGHIQFTHSNGAGTFYSYAGLTKEGRFWCGFKETGMPGTSDCTLAAWQNSAYLPAYPFQVYNESTTPAVSFYVTAAGAVGAKASLSTAPTLTASRYVLWQDTTAPGAVKLTVSDASATHVTHDLTAKELPTVTTDDNGKQLAVVAGAWAKAAQPVELPSVTTDDNGALLTVAAGAWGKAAPVQQMPAGMVMPYAGATPPTGWLACMGQVVSRTTYAALYSAIGDTYFTTAGETEFNLPDLRGEFVRGWDMSGGNARGVDTGRALGSAQADGIKSHTHARYYEDLTRDTGAGTYRHIYAGVTGSTTMNSQPHTGATTETRPRNIAMLYCIKT